MFDILHDATQSRGVYAFSAAFLNGKTHKLNIIRQHGHPKNVERVASDAKDVLFLGHNQAPTSSVRDWEVGTSHPFVAGNWVVAHNGVLTNHKDINKKHCAWNKNPVDTSCIPNLIHAFETKYTTTAEQDVVAEALSLLGGTFAVWIHNTKSHRTFVARQGSTLFANESTGDFCSIESKGWVEVPEGKLYDITQGFEQVGEFRSTSPFFTL